MIGQRMSDSDGFTYCYGKAKAGYECRYRYKNQINRCRRNDKRSVKAKELQQYFKDNS